MDKKVIAPSQQSPRAVVVLVHGMSEHKERYFPFMSYLAKAGYASIIADTRGHGITVPQGDLGYFGKDGTNAVINDAIELIEYAREQYPGVKLFLLGHSMGSMTVRCVLKRRPELIDGLMVIGSPSYNPGTKAGILLTKVMSLLRGEQFRSNLITTIMFGECIRRFRHEPLHNAWLSTNKENVVAYNQDPLCGYRFTLNGYRTVMELMEEVYRGKGWAPSTGIPVHFASGADDPFINTPAHFEKAAGSIRSHGYQRVSARLYPGLRHEILNENGREHIWTDLKTILDSWL